MLTPQEADQLVRIIMALLIFFTMTMLLLICQRGMLFMNLARVAPPTKDQLMAFQLKYGEAARKDLEKELAKLAKDKS